MAFNWVSMAWLTRSVTGVTWTRFLRAHLPAARLATLVALAGAAAAQAGRAAHLKSPFVLATTGAAVAVIAYTAARLWPAFWLGAHGAWGFRRVEDLLRRGSARLAPATGRAQAE
jgi:hypothetical protein